MKHLTKALSQIGISEFKGEQDNPEVLKYFNIIGFDGTKLKDETAWCSAFMNWVYKTSGLPYTGRLNARSWLNIGNKVCEPKLGDIVVLWRVSPADWRGHVGIFIRQTKHKIYILGGNQGNKVSIMPYRKSQLLEYRRL